MVTISVPTLTLATGVVGLSVTLVMALLYGRHRDATGYGALLRAIALHAFGLTVLGFEARFPDGVGVAVADAAMAISPVFYVQAIAQLLERRAPLRGLTLLAGLVIMVIVFLIFVDPSASLRLTVLGTYFLATQALEIGMLATGLRREPSAAYRTLFGLVVAITITMIWRTLWFASNPDAAHTDGTASIVLFVTNLVFFATTGLAWVGVLEDRYRRASLLASLELSRLSRTDDLTGLANRRHFDDVVAKEVARSLRYGRPLTLITLDLDHFKFVDLRTYASYEDPDSGVEADLTVTISAPGGSSCTVGPAETSISENGPNPGDTYAQATYFGTDETDGRPLVSFAFLSAACDGLPGASGSGTVDVWLFGFGSP